MLSSGREYEGFGRGIYRCTPHRVVAVVFGLTLADKPTDKLPGNWGCNATCVCVQTGPVDLEDTAVSWHRTVIFTRRVADTSSKRLA